MLLSLTSYCQNFQDSSENDLIKTLVISCHYSEIAFHLIHSKSQSLHNSLWGLQDLLSMSPLHSCLYLSDLILYHLSPHSVSAILTVINQASLFLRPSQRIFSPRISIWLTLISLRSLLKSFFFNEMDLNKPIKKFEQFQHILLYLSVLFYL